MTARTFRTLSSLALIPLLVGPVGGRDDDDDVQKSRELAGIAEEQALLQRQLLRLRNTMQVLLDRIEAEGRTRTAELLREGLDLLDERSAASAAALTLDERMQLSRESIEGGRLVQSIDGQAELIADLERLLSILMDRKNLEALEESIEELREMRASLEALVDREERLEEKTEDLREQSSNAAQKSLEADLAELLSEQRGLLDRNETLGRESGTLELELLERELERLIEDQRTDSEVLSAWVPGEKEELEALEEALAAARQSETRAARLSGAAETLRQVASSIEDHTPRAGVSPPVGEWADRLDDAAAREERHQRVSGDPAAERAAEALRAAAELVRAADLDTADPEPRSRTAEELRAKADELERAASTAREPARRAREQALDEANRIAERDTAGGAVAEGVRRELEDALRADEKGSPTEAAEATEEAAERLAAGVLDLDTLGRALSESQAGQAEAAERVGRQLETLAPGRTPSGQEAGEELERAAEEMRRASQAARESDAAASTEAAEKALEHLQQAAEALSGARDEAADQVAEKAREGAQDQGELADRTEDLEPKVDDASMNPAARESVRSALDEAAEAMRKAGEELSEGKSASAANSQRQAIDALQRAAQNAREGVTPSSPEDRQRAEELAAEQEKIREDLIDLARRIRERKNARPLDSLSRADSAAEQATEQLESGELTEAVESEEEVEREMRDTLEELREEEEAYERLRQEEILFRIAEEVSGMIESHAEHMAAVQEIDVARSGEEPSRAQKLRLRRIAREEEALGERAGEMAEAIEAEESQVSAQLMRDVQSDLSRIASDLGQEGDFQTGERVQSLQRDVEESLEVLLEALRMEQRRRQSEPNQQQDQQQPQQDQQMPLVPDVTELKLLRRMEVDVQEAVDRMLLLHPELQESPEDVDPLVLDEILRLASRHERITQLFAGFRAKVGLPDPDTVEDTEATED